MKSDDVIANIDIDKFWSNVRRKGPDDCWKWRGSIGSDGYGTLWAGDRNVRAHRAAFSIGHSVALNGGVVRHACDNPLCCNPAHLRLGTHQANVADRVSRGRSATTKGGNWKGGRGYRFGLKVGEMRGKRLAYWRTREAEV